MIKLFQIRQQDNGVETLGDYFLKDGDQVIFQCKTLELPFKGNQHEISCFPVGDYKCKKVPATEAIPYEHFSIEVPGRDGIAGHIANFVVHPVQLKGCTAVGSKYKDLNGDGEPDIVESKVTFEKLMSLLPDEFELSVNYEPNTQTT